MKTILLTAVCAASLTASATVSISPFDDAAYWFRGGVDIDGNGVYDSGSHDFRDITHAADTNGASHVCTLGKAENGRALAKTGRVVMPYANRALADAPYLHLEQVVTTNGWVTKDGKTYPNLTVKPNYLILPSVYNSIPASGCTNYTFFMRFRQSGIVSEATPQNNLIQLGFNWTKKSGLSVALQTDPKKTNERYPYVYVGNQHLSGTTAQNMRVGQWNDLAVVVTGNKVRLLTCANTNDTGSALVNSLFATYENSSDGTRSPVLFPSSDKSYYIGGESIQTATFTNGVTDAANPGKGFRGDIQSMAFWTRSLSDDEVRKVFSERRPALVQLGLANGSTDEFRKTADAVTADGLHPEEWNPVLNAAHPTAGVNFTIVSGEHATSQYLRVRPVGTAPATVSVAIDGQAISSLAFEHGRDAFAFVKSQFLTVGAHTLTLTRTDANGGDFAIDALALAGSWRIGTDAEHGGMASEDGTEGHPLYLPRTFPLTDGNLKHFTRGFVSGGNNASHTIPFEMPEDLMDWMREPTFTIRHTSSKGGQSISFDILINGTKWKNYTSKEWASNYFKIPLSLLKAGANTITITWTGGASWSNCSTYRFELGRPISGTLLIVK